MDDLFLIIGQSYGETLDIAEEMAARFELRKKSNLNNALISL